MNITKEYFEKQLKKHKKVTVYSQTNIPLTITTQPYITREGGARLHFEMDCRDLEKYCDISGLQYAPNKKNYRRY